MERYLAIDNVCAWPNLTRLPDGALVATIFNQPCHGAWEGDVECWGSEDGRTWHLRGVPARHAPGTNRMNVAAGLAANGDLLVIASGWDNRNPVGEPDWFTKAQIITPWVSRSADGGRTWEVREVFPAAPESGMTAVIPFGDVLQAADGSLCVSGYAGSLDDMRRTNSAYLFRSTDDGRSWDDGVLIGKDDYNETAPLHLGAGRWLAASRTHHEGALHLFVSDDDARTWRFSQVLTQSGQHPAHLLRLPDERILLTYGNRCAGHQGIDIRISADEGKTWGAPRQLVALDPSDLGYPSTALTRDGNLVTAWYNSQCTAHQRYHMGVLLWTVDDMAK